jgi:hypothetical protein
VQRLQSGSSILEPCFGSGQLQSSGSAEEAAGIGLPGAPRWNSAEEQSAVYRCGPGDYSQWRAARGEREVDAQGFGGAEAGINPLQPQEAPDHETGTHQEHHAEGDFRNH